jgi:hypothetical protein
MVRSVSARSAQTPERRQRILAHRRESRQRKETNFKMISRCSFSVSA